MVFNKKLSNHEVKTIRRIIRFVEDKHNRCEGHDFSHVLQVVQHAIDVGSRIKEEADPFIVICGALLHDIGRINAPNGLFHGIDGAARAEEFLESLVDDIHIIDRIEKVILRHTPSSYIPPKAVEEKIIHDADSIDRLGLIGMMRGVMGKTGTISSIIVDRIEKRLRDYGRLYFDESRRLARHSQQETLQFISELKAALKKRHRSIEGISSFRKLAVVSGREQAKKH